MAAPAYWFIGWDVGAWYCDNGDSRDALVLLNDQGKLVGTPWRGNLRSYITQSGDFTDWLHIVLGLCGLEPTKLSQVMLEEQSVTISIDTPLGFSNDFVALLTGEATSKALSKYSENTYLFRETELMLFLHGFRPLSAVQDKIGSQATKGLHFLRKLGFTPSQSGVWQLNKNQCQHHALESYPTVLKTSALVAQYIEQLRSQTDFNNWHQDIQDAAYCAIAALLYQQQPNTMATPTKDATSEGWIYVPKECLTGVRKR